MWNYDVKLIIFHCTRGITFLAHPVHSTQLTRVQNLTREQWTLRRRWMRVEWTCLCRLRPSLVWPASGCVESTAWVAAALHRQSIHAQVSLTSLPDSQSFKIIFVAEGGIKPDRRCYSLDSSHIHWATNAAAASMSYQLTFISCHL